MKISQLSEDSWLRFKTIRLKGLLEDPLAFGGNYEEELHFDEAQWRNSTSNMWFALIDDRIVGMIGLIKDINSSNGQLISFWVEPSYRRKGIGKALVFAIQEYARNNSMEKLFLFVTVTQETSIRLYEKMGFMKKASYKDRIVKAGASYDQYYLEWYPSRTTGKP